MIVAFVAPISMPSYEPVRRVGLVWLAEMLHNEQGYPAAGAVEATTPAVRPATAAVAEPQASMDVGMLPEGWVPKLSKSTGETYYYNVNTGESAWDMP
jgi:hypothetical protein